MKGIKNVIWNLLRAMNLSGYVAVAENSALRRWGWFESHAQRRAIDKTGAPIPWLTYPAILFLESRLRPEFHLFEYGAGSSTLWFMKRLASVRSVEHNPEWYNALSSQIQTNVRIDLRPPEQYAVSILETPTEYDMVLIDGIVRNDCARECLARLSPNGIIIFDNANVPDWQNGLTFLREQGFKRIDFIGMTPGVALEQTTAIFYRPDNCLDL